MMKRSIFLLIALSICLSATPMATGREQIDDHNPTGDEHSDPKLRPEILPPSQVTLPTSPADVPDKPTTGSTPDGQTILRGAANAISANIVSKAEILTPSPLSRYRGDKLVFYKVYIRNDGQTPVLILGKDAQFSEPEVVKNVKAATLENHDNTLLTPNQKKLVAAVGIGSAGLASSLFYEYMTPSENRHRDLGIALGRDRGRHEVESENLGTRLIMPGDDTNGWVAFEDNDTIRRQNTLRVPVMFPPYSTISSTLTIPITASPVPPPPPDKQTTR